MYRTKRGFTLIELLVVVAIIALLISILVPSVQRALELARRSACGANLSAVGKEMAMYTQGNQEMYPLAAAKILKDVSDTSNKNNWQAGAGSDGTGQKYREVEPEEQTTGWGTIVAPNDVPVTCSTWLLIKSGYSDSSKFICPATSDTKDDFGLVDSNGVPTGDYKDPEELYDFKSLNNISYSFQMPYGAVMLTGSSAEIAIGADRSPYFDDKEVGERLEPTAYPIPNSEAKLKNGNSNNHANEGQNVLWLGTRVVWEELPNAGANSDNIYTAYDNEASGVASNPELGQLENNQWTIEAYDSLLAP